MSWLLWAEKWKVPKVNFHDVSQCKCASLVLFYAVTLLANTGPWYTPVNTVFSVELKSGIVITYFQCILKTCLGVMSQKLPCHKYKNEKATRLESHKLWDTRCQTFDHFHTNVSYTQLSPSRHLATADTPLLRARAGVPAIACGAGGILSAPSSCGGATKGMRSSSAACCRGMRLLAVPFCRVDRAREIACEKPKRTCGRGHCLFSYRQWLSPYRNLVLCDNWFQMVY